AARSSPLFRRAAPLQVAQHFDAKDTTDWSIFSSQAHHAFCQGLLASSSAPFGGIIHKTDPLEAGEPTGDKTSSSRTSLRVAQAEAFALVLGDVARRCYVRDAAVSPKGEGALGPRKDALTHGFKRLICSRGVEALLRGSQPRAGHRP